MDQKNSDHFVRERTCSLMPTGKAIGICGAASAALLCIMFGTALAGTEVRGNPDDLQLRAENASTREILNALSAAFKLTFKLPPNIGRPITGVYSGTLHQVLGRILDGNDYIVKVSNNGTEIVILGASGATAIATSGHAITKSGNAVAPSVQPSSKPTSPGPKLAVPTSSPVLPPSGPILPDSSPPPPLATYLSVN